MGAGFDGQDRGRSFFWVGGGWRVVDFLEGAGWKVVDFLEGGERGLAE
jgi:hypothetical protein